MADPKPHSWPADRLPVGTPGVYTGYDHAGLAPQPYEVAPGDACVVLVADQTTGGTDLPVWLCLRTGEEFVEFSPCFTPIPEET